VAQRILETRVCRAAVLVNLIFVRVKTIETISAEAKDKCGAKQDKACCQMIYLQGQEMKK
jgi:hypothetical protein